MLLNKINVNKSILCLVPQILVRLNAFEILRNKVSTMSFHSSTVNAIFTLSDKKVNKAKTKFF